MPSSPYPLEVLKAQAVCARTYAWKQIKEKKLEAYGADVDDSVNYQVYNNIGREANATQAVKETKGRILSQRGEPMEVFIFQLIRRNDKKYRRNMGCKKRGPVFKKRRLQL